MGSQRDVPARDRGASLIEVLVSVVLLGVAGVAVLTALAATTVGARTHREVAEAQAGLASVADSLTAPGSGWWPCTTPDLVSLYQQAVVALFGDAHDVTVTGVEFWDGTVFGTACDATDGHRLQRVTLVAATDDGQHTFTVVKRPPASVVPTDGIVPITVDWESTFSWNQGGSGDDDDGSGDDDGPGDDDDGSGDDDSGDDGSGSAGLTCQFTVTQS